MSSSVPCPEFASPQWFINASKDLCDTFKEYKNIKISYNQYLEWKVHINNKYQDDDSWKDTYNYTDAEIEWENKFNNQNVRIYSESTLSTVYICEFVNKLLILDPN